MDRGVGTDQMVEGEQMGVAELHNTLGVGAHGSDIATELVPGKTTPICITRSSVPVDRPRGAGHPASDIVVEQLARLRDSPVRFWNAPWPSPKPRTGPSTPMSASP